MIKNSSISQQSEILILICVLLLSSVSAFWSLSRIMFEGHECFVSVTAREILQNGNWIMPTCNGEPRLQKTPLSYWLVAGLAKITGRVDEFTTRMPSAVFAVLSVAVIFYFVNHWLGFRIAVLSSAVWATSEGYILYSHTARPEMILTFFIVLSLLSFYSAVTADSRKKQVTYMLVFWVSFALGNLTKGPAPLPLVLIPVILYIVIFHRWKIISKLLPIVGPIIFLVIVLPWPLAVAQKVNWDLVVWKREFIDRFFGDYAKGNYPLYYYLLIMFKYTVPWVAFLPMALVAPFYKVWAEKMPAMKFLWLWFIANLVFLTIDAGKRQHYILPSMAATAILVGILLEDMAFARRAYTRKFAASVLKIHLVIIIAAAVAAPFVILLIGSKRQIHPGATNSYLFAIVTVLSVIAIAATVIMAILFAKGKPAMACGTVFAGIVVWVVVFYAGMADMLNYYNRYLWNFSQKLALVVPQSEKIVAYEHIPLRAVYYFGRVIPVIKDESALYERYQQSSWVVATGKDLKKLTLNKRFRMVYYRQKAEYWWGNFESGALFHKSAPVISDDI
jgi:4-amino-4-deoxy-L-arabinose transferase-like glycosyltransferase